VVGAAPGKPVDRGRPTAEAADRKQRWPQQRTLVKGTRNGAREQTLRPRGRRPAKVPPRDAAGRQSTATVTGRRDAGPGLDEFPVPDGELEN